MKKITYIFLAVILIAAFQANAAETASQVLEKTAARIKSAKGINADFDISDSRSRQNGSISIKGKKFAWITKGVSTWYDGKNMWTYNSASNETTLTIPSKEELAEINPLEYLGTYSGNYNVAFTGTGTTGKRIVRLTPKSNKDRIKYIDVTIQTGSLYKPAAISIVPKSGAKISITISRYSDNATLTDATFNYPKSKYPKVQIIDLR